MSTSANSTTNQWSSRWLFILAATGSAVGLGNVWKFPYITGENGGGAFVLVYLACILIIGIPVMMSEILLGRRGGGNPISAMVRNAQESGCHKFWAIAGLMGVLAGFLILTFYSVIAGWAADYVIQAATGQFTNASALQIDQIFSSLIANPLEMSLWTALVLSFTCFVVAKGLKRGLENAIRFMLPVMVAILLMLVFYAMKTGYFENGVRFLFHPHFASLTAAGVLIALGHAFFTLSLASGAIMMYGAYLPKHISITKSSIIIAIADTTIALIAGLAIFPIVFANQLQPAAGPGLIFETLPISFGHMDGGRLFATLFFIMLLLAALTSAISLLEPTIAWLVEAKNIRRGKAALISGLLIWILSFGTIFSFNIWHDVTFAGLNIFDLLDYLTANIMLPVGGLFIALFAAWRMKKAFLLDELQVQDNWLFKTWLLTLKVITPVAIACIFMHFVGLF